MDHFYGSFLIAFLSLWCTAGLIVFFKKAGDIRKPLKYKMMNKKQIAFVFIFAGPIIWVCILGSILYALGQRIYKKLGD